MSTRIFLTTTTLSSWTIPADFNNAANTIEVIGAGGGGGGSGGGNPYYGGGGGGAYSLLSNLNLTGLTTVQYECGTGGPGGPNGTVGTTGTDTWFNGATYGASSVGAKGGQGGQHGSGGAGGASSSGIGTTKYSGGAGGYYVGDGTGGGGGAAGLNGAGGTTGSGSGGQNGAQGDNGNGGAGGGFNNSGNGGAGSPGTEWDGSHGSGGGGGGTSSSGATGGAGGNYGGGGGAGDGGGSGNGGAGANGLIVITYTPVSDPGTRYWIGTGNWDASNTTNWSYTSGGFIGASVPTSSDNVYFDTNSTSSTITATANCANLICTGFTGTLTGSSALNVYGTFLLVAGMTYSVTGTLTFSATSTGMNITTAGKTLVAVVFNGVGGGWTFLDTPTITTSVTLTNGAINLGSTTVVLQGTGTVWSAASTFSLTAGTSTIKLTDASSSSKTFSGGGLVYNNLWITGSGTGAYTIVGNNTFADFKVDTPPHTINFTAGSYTRVATFTVNGTAGNLMTLQSTASGSKWYLAHTTGNVTMCDYLSIQDCTAL